MEAHINYETTWRLLTYQYSVFFFFIFLSHTVNFKNQALSVAEEEDENVAVPASLPKI